MITEKDCITLLRKYEDKNCPTVVWNGKCGLQYESKYQCWNMCNTETCKVFFKNARFEDVKDQIMDFFLKHDPSLEQKFLNKKHQKILQQPNLLEAL